MFKDKENQENFAYPNWRNPKLQKVCRTLSPNSENVKKD